jgi:NADH:ubiquinone oxidoreductase subunit E
MALSILNKNISGLQTEPDKAQLFDDINTIIDRYRSSSGAVIKILQKSQERCGYLPLPVLELISKEMSISLSKLYSILTFYHFFTLVPKGKYIIQVCKGTACYVKGGQKILDVLKREYALEPGGITDDGKFSLNMVRCLGCCGLAPVIAVGDDIYRKVKPKQITEILNNYD